MSNVRSNVQSAVIWSKASLRALLLAWLLLSPAGFAAEAGIQPQPDTPIEIYAPGVIFSPEPELLSPVYLEQEIHAWLNAEPGMSAADLTARLEELYLQSGYPGTVVESVQGADGWHISIHERPPQLITVHRLIISGGTPRERYLTRFNLHQREGAPLDRAQLLADVDWLEHNYFLPLQLRLQQVAGQPDQVDVDLHIVTGSEFIPTGNLALNDEVALAVTAGVILDNPFNSGQIIRAMGKRNNIPFPGVKNPNVVQDWEYTLSWATTIMPIEGMSLGLNHYNKVDYLYPDFNGQAGEMVWIRSLGADLYSGFPIWSDPASRRYLRGVANLTLLEDRFTVSQTGPAAPKDKPESLTQSGKTADLLLMPSLTISYADIDNYRLPQNGNFLQARLGGSLLDATFTQATLTGSSYWTPYADERQQWTFLLRSAAGTTFGANPPFYRGFLNTGSWLVRGATQYSITEKHSLRFAEELHYIYKPTSLEVDRFLQVLIGQTSGGAFDDWAIDLNAFLDEGAYWRDAIVPRSGQLSVGGGFNLISPGGSILGLDFASSVYPVVGGVDVLLRLSSPFSYTLYSDWGNTNGYFLR